MNFEDSECNSSGSSSNKPNNKNRIIFQVKKYRLAEKILQIRGIVQNNKSNGMEIQTNSVSMCEYACECEEESEKMTAVEEYTLADVMNGKLSAESINVERKKKREEEREREISIEKSLFKSDYKYVDK